jgi:hypothetical protein
LHSARTDCCRASARTGRVYRWLAATEVVNEGIAHPVRANGRIDPASFDWADGAETVVEKRNGFGRKLT